MNNKGQMFLIAAAVTIIVLVLLKNTINISDIIQKKSELVSTFEREFFKNTINELVRVIDISYHQPNNITNNVFGFGNFTRKKMTERLQTFQLLYVSAITPSNSSSAVMNVTFVNLLNKPINATSRLNSSSPVNFSVMVDSSQWSINYSFTQGNNYVLTIGYNDTFVENITIETMIKQSRYFGFFDVTLIGSETTYKDKFQKSYNLGSTGKPYNIPTTTIQSGSSI